MRTRIDTNIHHGSRGLRLSGLILAASLAIACGEYDGGTDAMTAGGLGSAGSGSGAGSGSSGGASQAESIQAFSNTVLPMLQTNCSECHAGAGPGSPSIAHPPSTMRVTRSSPTGGCWWAG